MAGLASGTKYYYSIGTPTVVLAGGDANHFFITAPAPGTQRPTRIWVLGDSGTADNNARAVRDAYLGFTGATYTDLVLMLGDNAYNSGTDGEYQAAVFNMYPTMLRQSVLWATLGNHDGIAADSLTQTGPYYNIFSFPRSGEAGGLPSGTEAYYSFEFGNIHFINLESFETNRSSSAAMMTWLANDLAQNTKQWTIAFWHHPPYTKGSHNSDTETELVEMRQNALPILENAGVDLILTGHSHSYERSYLIDGHYGLSTTFNNSMKKNGGDGRPLGNGAYVKPSTGPAPHEGAVYAVAGSSGQISGGTLNHPAMFISLNQLGSMVLDVNGGRLDAVFLDAGGVTRDSFTIVKGGPPVAPTGLTATPISTSQINLSWTDRSNNEDSFSIERSTNGVSFSQIATAAANSTSYAVTGLSATTLYYFRVIAVNNTYGSSSPSNVASATTLGSGPPVLSSVSPSSGAQGNNVSVTLTGTNFIAGAMVAVSGSGVTVSNVVVVSQTQITATFQIVVGAAVGARNVNVTTSAGTSGPQTFTVTGASSTPTLTSLSPPSGAPGTTVHVTLKGTKFTSPATVKIQGNAVTVTNVIVVDATTITADFQIAANAKPRSWNTTVTTLGGTSNALPFTVSSSPPR